MDSQPRRSNENSELKTFMFNLRSGNLIKLIESNQKQFEEKCTYLTQKLRKSEEEIRNKLLLLQQNSHLIEKFQNQLKEVSDQNTELLDQQQTLKEENENLKTELQNSEDKFAQLDIAYDQEVSVLSQVKKDLEIQLAELKNSQSEYIDQFQQAQTELNEKLEKSEQNNVELLNKLTEYESEKKSEQERFEKELFELSDLNDILKKKIIDCEERIQDLQCGLSSALDSNKELHNLKNKIKLLNDDREADQKAFDMEKSRIVAGNEELKVVIEDLKKKICKKEKEVEELFLKLKQIAGERNVTPTASASIMSSKFPKRKQQNASSDDPKPLDDSSDSDGSSISFYRHRVERPSSTDIENENLFDDLKTSVTLNNKSKTNGPKYNFRAPLKCFRKNLKPVHDDIEIPESPIVSSSAFGNNDHK